MKSKKKLILIDTDKSFKKTVLSQLEDDVIVSLTTHDTHKLIEHLNNKPHPQFIIINICCPIINDNNLSETLKKEYPDIKLIGLYDSEDKDYHEKFSSLFSYDAYINRKESFDVTKKTIEKVTKKGFYYSKEQIRDAHRVNRIIYTKEIFTKREKEILFLISKQYTTQEISEKLFLSPRTIEGHRNSMLLKSSSKNVAGLLVFAFKNKLIQ